MESPATALLIITGSMGSGKTAVMTEASDILAARGIAHAAIDLDELGIVHPEPEPPQHAKTARAGDPGKSNVAVRNLRCVWENFAALGVTRLLLAAAIENREELEACCAAVGSARPMVCRLTSGVATMEQRVRAREIGMLQQQFVDRVAVLENILDLANLEDFQVANENRSVTEVAEEMLVRAGWIQHSGQERGP